MRKLLFRIVANFLKHALLILFLSVLGIGCMAFPVVVAYVSQTITFSDLFQKSPGVVVTSFFLGGIFLLLAIMLLLTIKYESKRYAEDEIIDQMHGSGTAMKYRLFQFYDETKEIAKDAYREAKEKEARKHNDK